MKKKHNSIQMKILLYHFLRFNRFLGYSFASCILFVAAVDLVEFGGIPSEHSMPILSSSLSHKYHRNVDEIWRHYVDAAYVSLNFLV